MALFDQNLNYVCVFLEEKEEEVERQQDFESAQFN